MPKMWENRHVQGKADTKNIVFKVDPSKGMGAGESAIQPPTGPVCRADEKDEEHMFHEGNRARDR
jgi:hypothetical protein